MAIEFEFSQLIPASPETIYDAWLDSRQHSDMTGGEANVSAVAGDRFNAWDGYITGQNLELDPPRRILQHWRTTEFQESDEDSLLDLSFEPEGSSTRVTIRHSNLPDHGMRYRQGWVEAYFNPMKAYFGKREETGGS
jgi:uncharacterized protein YndB with AHSA1/START domain